jgi:hypothetical protein
VAGGTSKWPPTEVLLNFSLETVRRIGGHVTSAPNARTRPRGIACPPRRGGSAPRPHARRYAAGAAARSTDAVIRILKSYSAT